ncbi:hypothetical protein BLNAU_9813 [Blattamonas nauphoetae]|uniref:Protein kinase domain-containing protein n=1 Tax=Blattamonas nauphoetae TaxID=2049346 RepID=A0ABQ9XUW0_9EUKA|nr:hypothetical protein BLNAU_9813 [Blattamonas nauphoetae]
MAGSVQRCVEQSILRLENSVIRMISQKRRERRIMLTTVCIPQGSMATTKVGEGTTVDLWGTEQSERPVPRASKKMDTAIPMSPRISTQAIDPSDAKKQHRRTSLKSFTLTVPSSSSLTSAVLVLSSTGTLSLTSIHVDGEDSVFTQSLINAEVGSLQISSSSFRNIEMSGHALIETSCVVDIEECSFSDISREGNNATVLAAIISQATPPSVSSSTVSMRKTSFENCMPTESQRWVELIGRNSETFSSSSWTGTFNKTSIWGGIVVDDGITEIEDDLKPFSLIYEFFRRTDSKLIVSSVSGNVDHPLCGHSQLPCRSIDVGRALTSVQTIEIVSIGEIGGVLEVGNETVRLSGHNGRGKMGLIGTGQIVSNDETDPGRLFVSQLEIDVSGSTLIDQSIFLIKTGSLNFESCSLISSKAVTSTLILNEGSSILMTNTTFALNTTGAGMLVDSTKGTVDLSLIHLTLCSFQSAPFSFSDAASITLTSVEMKLCNVSELMSVKNVSSFSLVSSSFVGSSSAPNEEDDASCEWLSGLVTLSDTTATISGTTFSSLGQGGLLLTNTHATLSGCTFTLNQPESAVSESVRRNIRCLGESSLEIESIHAGDGLESDALWISNSEDCKVTRQKKQILTPLFTATLSPKSCKSVLNRKTGEYSIGLVGTMLIPCSLKLEVYETDENEGKSQDIILSEKVGTWTDEKELTLSVKKSELKLEEKLEWRGRLLFVGGETESFLVKMSAIDERKSLAKQVMRWLGPLIGGLVVLFILFLIILLLVRRHRKQKANKTNKTPLAAQELDENMIAVEKFDYRDSLEDTNLGLHSHYDLPTNASREDNTRNDIKEGKISEEMNESILGGVAVHPQEVMEVSAPNRQDTLFNRLHHPQKGVEVDVGTVRQQIVAALVELRKKNQENALLTNLNPHCIFFDSAGVVRLQVQQHPHPSNVEESKPSVAKSQKEGDRWKAPEVAQEVNNVDASKAAVFSLGLILWELETKQVPFRELDAMNAQRQMGLGVQPLMTDIEEEWLVSLIQNCLDLNPKNRPTLENINSLFVGPSLHDRSLGANGMQKQHKNQFVPLANI